MAIKGNSLALSTEDRDFIDYLRGALILRVVLTHLGLSWFFLPYSSYVEMFFPALFLVSGMVTYNSFIDRKTSNGKFFFRRNVNLLTTYYLITGLALLISFLLNYSSFPSSFSQTLDWIFINQSIEDQPYHMTQIWFLRSLVIITFFCIPFFLLSEKSRNILLIPVAISLSLGAIQLVTPIGRSFNIQLGDLNGINIFHPLANFGYFCFGAWCVRSGFLSKTHALRILATMCILISASIFLIFSLEPRLNYHSYYQNLYYMSLGYAAIFFIFSFKELFKKIIDRFNPIKETLKFFSYHAFSIFLIHSFFIIFAEETLGLKGSAAPDIIIPKILFVLIFSCIFSIPLTLLAKKSSSLIIKKMDLK